jgi:hypothetical protein
MASPDELLADIRQAERELAPLLIHMREFAGPKPIALVENLMETAGRLGGRFGLLDQHMTETGEPPSDWASPDGWDVVIACESRQEAVRRSSQIQFACSIRQRGDDWQVYVPFPAPRTAENARAQIQNRHGWDCTVRPRRHQIPATPKEATQS